MDGGTVRRTDRWTDGQTDGGDYNIRFAFLKSVGITNSILLAYNDQMMCVMTSDFSLHCLGMSHKMDAGLIWVI